MPYNQRFQYQVRTFVAPGPFPGNSYFWFAPLSDPVRKPSRAHLVVDAAFSPFFTTPETVTVDKWWRPLEEPVRKYNRSPLAIFYTADTSQIFPGFGYYGALAEPVRKKPIAVYFQPFTADTSQIVPSFGYYDNLTDPPKRNYLKAPYHPYYFKPETVFEFIFADKWFQWFSEPRRFLRGLPVTQQKAHFEPDMQPIPNSDGWWATWLPQRPHNDYRVWLQPFYAIQTMKPIINANISMALSAVETKDVASISILVSRTFKGAKVSIIELSRYGGDMGIP